MRTLNDIENLLAGTDEYDIHTSKRSYGNYYSVKYSVNKIEVSITGKTLDEIWERLERASLRGVAIPQLVDMSSDDGAQHEHKKIVDEDAF